MTDDESKRLILARRARFVAAALASAGISAASCNKNAPESNPQPCLSVPVQRVDAAPPPSDVPPSDVPPAEPPPSAPPSQEVTPPVEPPHVCLSPMPPPPPRPDAGTSKKQPT